MSNVRHQRRPPVRAQNSGCRTSEWPSNPGSLNASAATRCATWTKILILCRTSNSFQRSRSFALRFASTETRVAKSCVGTIQSFGRCFRSLSRPQSWYLHGLSSCAAVFATASLWTSKTRELLALSRSSRSEAAPCTHVLAATSERSGTSASGFRIHLFQLAAGVVARTRTPTESLAVPAWWFLQWLSRSAASRPSRFSPPCLSWLAWRSLFCTTCGTGTGSNSNPSHQKLWLPHEPASPHLDWWRSSRSSSASCSMSE